LDEQEQIVARINELKRLCDQFEASLANAETTRSRLLEALLADALAPVAREIQVAQ
jgi:type I restriction enzyme, S subunit